MPEFEETEPTNSPAESYTPSTDASKKPRSRRRSGGFKTEVASASKGNMGPVDPASALKGEKLSGSGKPADSDSKPREERAPRKERAPRAEREERVSREPRAPSPERVHRVPRAE